ncbi:MAG: Ig-like domain-containing protein [Myxococcaceae bacterium]|nr:Ig-like domain-containing protein [Myxococcaceae bacterium]
MHRLPARRALALLFTLAAFSATAETYYGRNPINAGGLTLVGVTAGTTWEVRALPSNALVQQGTLSRLALVTVPLNTTREFKLVTSRPVLAVLGADCCNYSGSFFYPQEDGRKFWGRRFVFTPMANGANQQFVYARDPAVVRVLDGSGNQVAVSPTLAAGQRWQVTGVVPNQTYEVVSSAPTAVTSAALVALQATAGNGNTQVPPVARDADGLTNDCNNDRGVEFYFSTYSWRRGSIVVFNPGSSAITFSLQTVTGVALANTAGYQNVTVAPGTAFLNSAANGFASLGTAQYRLVATGPVTLWAGDQEAGDGIGDLGDDVTSNFGENGRSFLVHSQTQGATVFALEANTQVTYSSGGAPTTVTLGVDGFLQLPANNTLYTVTSTRPVSIQTVGANGLNDWAVALRPAEQLDTDGNGLENRLEGTSCTSIAPNTDGDGRFDFEDTDDDNDCLPDSAEPMGGRTVPSIPNASASNNCTSGTLRVCDTTAGQPAVCRECVTTANCSGGRVCNPASFTCVTPPTTVITSRPPNPSSSSVGTFVFQSPGNPTATFECSLDGGPFTACSAPFTTGVLADGSHTFRVRATVGGITDPMPASHTWTVDTGAPAAPIVATPVNGSRTSTNRPTVTGTAEPGSTVTVFIDGVAVGTVTPNAMGAFSFTPSALADGPHVVSATARDGAGNTSPMSAFNQFIVDTTPPPAPVILAPAMGGTVGSATPTFSGTAEPGSTVTVRVDGMALGTVTADATGGWTFTSPIALVAGPHTVTARATDAVGNVGPDAPVTSFTVDLTVLDTTIASSPPALSSSGTASFVFSSNKPGASYECDLDNAGFTACPNPATFAGLADGAHTLRVRALRGAEVDPTPASYTWTVDGTPPAPPFITAPVAGATFDTSRPTVTGTGTAGDVVTVIVDGVPVGTATVTALGTWSLTLPAGLADGPHTVRATARDAAGNTSAPSMSVSFTIDTTAPLPPLVTSPVAGTTLSTATPTYTGTAEPNATVRVEVDGVVVGTVIASASGAWSLLSPSPLSEGSHTVRARAADAVGNESAPGPAVTFSVDTAAPAVPSLTSPAAGASVATNRPLVQGTADPGSTVTIRIDGVVVGTVVASSSGAFTFSPPSALTDGPHQVTAQATDAVGNTSAQSAPRTFTVDTAAPAAPVVTSPANNAIVGLTSPTVRGTAEANAIVTVIVDSVAAGTVVADASGNWTFTTAPLSQGQHSVSATARDAAGNVSPAATQVVFTVDTTVLDTSILTGPRTPSPSATAEFSFSSNKTPVTYECSLDMAAFAPCANPVTFSGLADGQHRLEVRARTSTETDTTPASYLWTVDTVAPLAPQVATPANGAVLASGLVVVTGTSEPGATVTIILDSGIAGTVTADAMGAFSLALPTTVADGPHTVSARATDAAGNVGPVSAVNAFTIDTVAPAAPSLASPMANALLATNRPVIAGAAEPGATVTITIDGMVAGTVTADAMGRFSFTPMAALADGMHTVSATARDAAGNVSPSSMPISFTTDTTAPMAPVITAPASGTSTNDATPTLTGTAEPGATVTVRVDGMVVGTATADAMGTFTFTVPMALPEGSRSVTATATDAAMNVSPASSPVTLTVDTRAPAAPSIVSPADGSTVQTTTPAVSGQAEPGATVRVFIDGTLVGTTTADMSGAFSLSLPPGQALTEGAHDVRVDATDAAGNRSPEATNRFTVRLPRPDGGVDGGLDGGADGGADGGLDGGADAGVDGGADAGLDAGGGPDAGAEVEDGGAAPLLPDLGFRGGGCGCTSTDAGSLLALAGLLGLLRRRRR